ncbi:phytanoyl-CoA dioxygenase family protein [Hymenobacter sp. BT770]|uniref:phytanoyl-CoA dioxygenase family protein n=1 Tax=Hymenobacter sp. BT770 TaxID=2886942 RepID=UPI001D10464F|nr:phytanoyl-CoA dioxygenase family protein [Hymenobacter sp. BT770]MCC3153990.1 phytanoyl-CoA dioxygenase family protein [Hymenobacter sp. BT770]MDO3416080.1 phytanoyl-CoA dioxygenase family protein [Hymenobacter sp. BT770]
MLSFLRRLKLSYSVYNVFQHRKLVHNLPLYERLGLNKQYYSPISSRDFAHLPPEAGLPPVPSLADRLAASPAFRALPAESQASLLAFEENGFAVLPGYFSPETVDGINQELNQLVATKQVSPRYRNKFMFAFRHSERIRKAGEGALRALVAALLGHETTLFQSINFLTGSEQRTHSDSIHMSTFPLGGLAAAWVALEDITPDNGPLHYYPGSHKLPYYLNADYANEGTPWLTGNKEYTEYEATIAQKITEAGLPKQIFLARKGDVFIWHANLMHGGEPHRDKAQTRKSMVFHYFSRAHICYHEITQRPALLG